MRELELHRVVYVETSETRQRITVRYEAGVDPEDAIDNVLRGLRVREDWTVQSIWAVPDEGIVTYSCKVLGNFRRGDPIPRQHDRTL